ncbi:hypothetical protein BV22DRAFT_572534 [Leucogyrophana mollusca]|uniref:Uncharacterized protein n=1 Tax=Leucogyrophana mollusca TaxID=85980 RepID=A0ACB8BD21_9AGAM|nr:hypothetical protein BV22DRAFT_572534 [Leucogyrophana mollusca]
MLRGSERASEGKGGDVVLEAGVAGQVFSLSQTRCVEIHAWCRAVDLKTVSSDSHEVQSNGRQHGAACMQVRQHRSRLTLSGSSPPNHWSPSSRITPSLRERVNVEPPISKPARPRHPRPQHPIEHLIKHPPTPPREAPLRNPSQSVTPPTSRTGLCSKNKTNSAGRKGRAANLAAGGLGLSQGKGAAEGGGEYMRMIRGRRAKNVLLDDSCAS